MTVKTEKFNINIDGDKTGTQWHGEFEAKVFLSHRDELRRDALRRQYLGDVAPQYASSRQSNQADVFSELAVRIITAPTWWNENGGGMDMIDDNVVGKVYDAVMGLEKKAMDDIKKKTEDAKKTLEGLGGAAADKV